MLPHNLTGHERPSLFPDFYEHQPGKRLLIRDLPPEERPLTRLWQAGVRAMSDGELLALVLGTADGLDLAREVLAATGGAGNLGRFTSSQLQQVRGIGEAQAARMLAAVEIGRRAMRPAADERLRITSPSDAANLIMPEVSGAEQEHLYLVMLDTRNRLIGLHLVYIGSINSINVRLADVFRVAIVNSAAAVIVAHNHPSGDCSPSPEDVSITKLMAQMGSDLGIELLDHLIVGCGRFMSLKEQGVWS